MHMIHSASTTAQSGTHVVVLGTHSDSPVVGAVGGQPWPLSLPSQEPDTNPIQFPSLVVDSAPSTTTPSELENGPVGKETGEDFSDKDWQITNMVKAAFELELKFSYLVMVVSTTQDTVLPADANVVGPVLYDALVSHGNEALRASSAFLRESAEMNQMTISTEQLKVSLQSPEIRILLKGLKSVKLSALLESHPRKLENVFTELDKNKSGEITNEEWLNFLKTLQDERTKFIQKNFFVQQCSFAGLGLDPEERFYAFEILYGLWVLRAGPLKLTRGWCEDFWFYSKNNHPALALCLAEEGHPFGKGKQWACFLTGLGCLLFVSGLFVSQSPTRINEDIQDGRGVGPLMVFGFITIPTMILNKLFYYMLVGPCFLADESATGKWWWRCLRWSRRACKCLGYLMACGIFVASAIFGALLWAFAPSSNVPSTGRGAYLAFYLYAILQHDVVWFLQKLSTTFFPFKNCCGVSQINRLLAYISLGDNIIGGWLFERKNVLSIIYKKIQQRGPKLFIVSDSSQNAFKGIIARNSDTRTRLKTRGASAGLEMETFAVKSTGTNV